MGVDPGLTRCGLSVIESGQGRTVIALDVDVVRTPAGEQLHRRLLTISDTVEYWMDTHRVLIGPDARVLDMMQRTLPVIYQRFVTTSFKLASR